MPRKVPRHLLKNVRLYGKVSNRSGRVRGSCKSASVFISTGFFMTTIINEDDFIQSIADAVQFISFYHPADYIQHLARAYEAEKSPAAKDAIAQILTNSRLCAEGKRPICQDTGVVNVFLKIGMDVRFASSRSVQ